VLGTRVATALVALPTLWLIVWKVWPPVFALFILAVTAIGLAEYAAMALPAHPRYRAAAVVMGTAVAAGVIAGAPWLGLSLWVALLVGLAHPLRPGVQLDRAVGRVGLWWLGVAYVGFLMPHVVLLREIGPDGWRWVLFAVFVAMGSDTGGYFGGRWLGRRKLLPAVSPAKTVEGAAGAVVGAAVVALACRAAFLSTAGGLEAIALGVAVSLLAQAGDLCESAFKRAFGAKDSGWIIPGHGGILDRLDSLLFPFVLVYHYVALAGM
jgi:phosphatidate cytidylyltransferase